MRWSRVITWSAAAAGLLILAACVLWAIIADTMVPRYCDLPVEQRPAQVGYLECDIRLLEPPGV